MAGLTGTVLAQADNPVHLTFKGNYLGMSLDEFKQQNVGEHVFLNTGKPRWNGGPDKKFNKEVPTPLCTDEYRGFPGDNQNLAPDEVLCNVAPGEINQAALRFGGIRAAVMLYRFNNKKLYQIEISFSSGDYLAVKSAFFQKYGQPTKLTTLAYQNGYGANWQGEVSIWNAGNQTIVATEGSGNGPAQNPSSPTTGAGVVFSDTANQPASSARKPDF